MLRKVVSRLIEWALAAPHRVVVNGGLPKVDGRHPGDAGYDMIVSKTVIIPARGIGNVPSGIHMAPVDGIWFQIVGRSSTFHKRGLQVIPAVIDNGYRGEMFAAVYNPGRHDVKVYAGERLAQLLPFRVIPCEFDFGKLTDSSRGRRGFGSTGGFEEGGR